MADGVPADFYDPDAPAWASLDALEAWCDREGIALHPHAAIPTAGPLSRRLAAAQSWCRARGNVNPQGVPVLPPELQGLGLHSTRQRLERFGVDPRDWLDRR